MTFQQDLVRVVSREWDFWGRHDFVPGLVPGTPVGKDKPFSDWVGIYSKSLPKEVYDGLKNATDGDLSGANPNFHWSAVFISFCMRVAGARDRFPYSFQHATWIKEAVCNVREGRTDKSLHGFRPGEKPVDPGDLLELAYFPVGLRYECIGRNSRFAAHSLIVVAVDTDRCEAYAIGANAYIDDRPLTRSSATTDNVMRRKVAISPSGHLDDTAGNWVAHIKLNIAD